MSILLTGATGFIGSSVLKHLLSEGHTVTALVRDDAKARIVEAAGATPLVGDALDAELVTRAARESEGVIHTADLGPDDNAFVTAVFEGLADSGKAYVHTGGIWTYGDNSAITEDSAGIAAGLTGWRLPIEERVRKATGIRTILVQPGIVYGYGRGLPNLVVNAPRDADGALQLMGHGDQHWTTVHVDDLAALYVLAYENAAAGSVYAGASGQNPTVREMGEAAAKAASIASGVVPETVAATRARLGDAFADALILNQKATGSRAKIDLGWEPNGPSLVEELATGSYAPRS
ncbi:MAG: Epimerase [Leifsonia sp.]|nr:Epimerase [Leifsonia sp.]